MPPPDRPKIYHILHVDRLASVLADGVLWGDAVMAGRAGAGTTIGISSIKERRLSSELACRPGLHVGDCVPFYFCPRSVMLYLIHRANHPELTFRGGQEPIIHLEADLYDTVAWAEGNGSQWAFTLSNAGSFYFEDRCDLAQLDEVNWQAVAATIWSGGLQDGKQAEFLIENRFPCQLVQRVGVCSEATRRQVLAALGAATTPVIEVRRDWYY